MKFKTGFTRDEFEVDFVENIKANHLVGFEIIDMT
jgi:hypothetical protein